MIKLVSSNIERSKHFDVLFPFIEREQPDIWCVQEVVERDIPTLSRMFGSAPIEYAPMLKHMHDAGQPIVGVAVFSRLPVLHHESVYYVGSRDKIPEHVETPDRGSLMNCAIALCDVERDGARFRIGTTHFTWSEKALPDDVQRRSMRSLLSTLEPLGDFVLCGDFNAPRGGEIFAMLAQKYRDNIPVRYETSIDVNLHRAGHLPSERMDRKMVDGLFSTPEYVISDVELHSGVSDHMAITATIGKA